jgi:hypothetical protein
MAEINIRSLAPLLKQQFDTEVEQLEFLHSTDIYLEFLKRYQQETHGLATFVRVPAPDPERHKAWQITSRINGELDGIMLYDLKGDSPTQFKMTVHRFYYLNPETRYHFLKWIAHHIDQANQVSIVLPSFEKPQTWFSDLEVNLSVGRINPMGRVLDIEKLNGIPVGEGKLSARITDPTCPWNDGIWQFESQAGLLSATRAANAGCEVGIQGISSLVFGNVPPEEFQYRGWGVIPPSIQDQMTSLFPPAAPHLHEYF